MLDFFKFPLDNPEKLRSNKLLDFKSLVSYDTGELDTNRKIASYENIKIEILNNSYILIKGSFHKFYKGGYNYDDFTYSEIVKCIKKLIDIFEIDPSKIRLENLEFGVNLKDIGIEISELFRAIIHNKGKRFSEMSPKEKSIGIDSYRQRYGFKIYSKSLQLDLPDQILRVEIKCVKMHQLNKLGIVFLSDLLDKQKLALLGKCLIKKFNALFILDPSLHLMQLDHNDRRIIDMASNPLVWAKLDRKAYKSLREKFKRIERRVLKETLRNRISTMIENKWAQLINS